MKMLGAGFENKSVHRDFHYKDLGKIELPEAYELLLLDAIQGDAILYARAEAVEVCWEFITPILQAWQENPDIKLYSYPGGSWGPKEASSLFLNKNENWLSPTEELANKAPAVGL